MSKPSRPLPRPETTRAPTAQESRADFLVRIARADQAHKEALAIMAKLRGPNFYTEEVDAPGDIAVALITGRPAMLRLVKPQALTEEECGVLYRLIATLIETNAALRLHAEETARMTKNMLANMRGIITNGAAICDFANFHAPVDDGDGEE